MNPREFTFLRVMADDPTSTRDDLASKLMEVKNLSYLVYEKVPL